MAVDPTKEAGHQGLGERDRQQCARQARVAQPELGATGLRPPAVQARRAASLRRVHLREFLGWLISCPDHGRNAEVREQTLLTALGMKSNLAATLVGFRHAQVILVLEPEHVREHGRFPEAWFATLLLCRRAGTCLVTLSDLSNWFNMLTSKAYMHFKANSEHRNTEAKKRCTCFNERDEWDDKGSLCRQTSFGPPREPKVRPHWLAGVPPGNVWRGDFHGSAGSQRPRPRPEVQAQASAERIPMADGSPGTRRFPSSS